MNQEEQFDEVAAEPAVEAEVTEQPVQTPPRQENDQERNWREVNRVLNEMKEENRLLRTELSKVHAPAPVAEEPEERLDPDDLLTVKQFQKQFHKEARKILDKELSTRDSQTAEQLFMARNPDYEDTIKKYLPDLISENPHLKDAIASHPRPHELAYNAVKQSWRYRSEQTIRSPQAEKVLKNASRPASGNAAAGSLKSKVDGFVAGKSPQQIWEESQSYIRQGGR